MSIYLDNEVVSDIADTAVTDENGTTVETKSFDSAGTNQNRLIENDRYLSSTGIPYTPKSRKKRSLSSEYVVELMIVADKKMADYHGDALHNYILTLMSIVRDLFFRIAVYLSGRHVTIAG